MAGQPLRAHAHVLRKGRLSLPGQIYLITTATHNREPLFANVFAGRCVVRELIADGHSTLAYVVMPDHLHWLLVLHDGSLPSLVQKIKSRSAIAVNRCLHRSGTVWQRGYHDHALRKEEDLRRVTRYLIANPLRATLTDDIRNYPLWDAVWL